MLSRRAVLVAPAVALLRSQERQGQMFGDAEAYERFMGLKPAGSAALRWICRASGGRADSRRGIGTGALAFSMAEHDRKARVLGIDPSAEYVAYAKSRNRFGDRASFEVGDAQQLRFPDGSFDAAVSLLVFNFISDAKKALLELRRVTKPGGTVAAAVWDYGARMRMLRIFWDAAVKMDPGRRSSTRSTCLCAGLASLRICGSSVDCGM